MAILVTGGAGYIGSATVEMLRAEGQQVVVLDNLVYGHKQAIFADTPFYEGSIGDRELLRRITGEHDIEACVHFAAYAYVGESVEKPGLYYENNVAQGLRLLDSLIEANIRRIDSKPKAKKQTHGFQVHFLRGTQAVTRMFSDAIHGGKESARRAARKFRKSAMGDLPARIFRGPVSAIVGAASKSKSRPKAASKSSKSAAKRTSRR